MGALNQPYLIIDNETVKYKANSIETMDGSGEVNTRAEQTGGGKASAVHTVNGETMISEIKVTLLSTTDSKELVAKLNAKKKTGETFVAQVFDGNDADVFTNCMLTNHVPIQYGQEGDIVLEIKGNQLD